MKDGNIETFTGPPAETVAVSEWLLKGLSLTALPAGNTQTAQPAATGREFRCRILEDGDMKPLVLFSMLFVFTTAACGAASSHVQDAPTPGAVSAFAVVKDLPLGWYGTDACDSRAYLASMAMALKGIASEAFRLSRGSRTLVPPKFGGQVRWSNHVAPLVDGWMVDPALADGPVSVSEWSQLAGLHPADTTWTTWRVPGSWGFVSGSPANERDLPPAGDPSRPLANAESVEKMPDFIYEAALSAFSNVMYQLESADEQRALCATVADQLIRLQGRNKLTLVWDGAYRPLPPAWVCSIDTDGTSIFVRSR